MAKNVTFVGSVEDIPFTSHYLVTEYGAQRVHTSGNRESHAPGDVTIQQWVVLDRNSLVDFLQKRKLGNFVVTYGQRVKTRSRVIVEIE